MQAPSQPLRSLLWICVAYFVSMGTAHFFGIKLPLLFVYFDTPFYAYQDKIIAFTLITYVSLFVAAARHRVMVPYALASFWGTVLGLSAVNLSGSLAEVLEGQGTSVYWVQVALFAALAATLTWLYLLEKRREA